MVLTKFKWEDAFEVRQSKNTRGEDTFDVYRKGTEEMIAADVRKEDIEEFLQGLARFVHRVATEELEEMLGNEVPKPSTEPVEAKYIRTRQYGSPWAEIEEEDK